MKSHYLLHPNLFHEIDDAQISILQQLNMSQFLIIWIPIVLLLAGFVHLLTVETRNQKQVFSWLRPNKILAFSLLSVSILCSVIVAIHLTCIYRVHMKLLIYFAVSISLMGLSSLSYSEQNRFRLLITTSLVILSIVANELLYIESLEMIKQNIKTQKKIYNHIARNLLSFNAALLLLAFFQLVFNIIFYDMFGKRRGLIWVGYCIIGYYQRLLVPLFLVGMLLLNTFKYGPFIDNIGCLVLIAYVFFREYILVYWIYTEEDDEDLKWDGKQLHPQ